MLVKFNVKFLKMLCNMKDVCCFICIFCVFKMNVNIYIRYGKRWFIILKIKIIIKLFNLYFYGIIISILKSN